ncbi:MAG TPA: D-aminoacylase [Terriglobia bacterium]|nr:D-aminoacylase [Terriglobia bacterium]
MIRIHLVVALVCLTLLSSCRKAPEPQFDLIIRNGNVVDGSGELWFPADVAVKGDTVVKVGRLDETELSAKQTIDAHGLTVAPGFIDIHSHSDYSLLVDGTAQSKIRQGVTTEVLGEAPSAGPLKGKARKDLSQYGLQADWKTLGEYFDRLQKGGMSVNVASYVGATQIRSCVLGDESRAPTAAEVEEMRQLAVEAMHDGAMGLSSSLIVPPDTYLDTRQLTDLASAVQPFGGIYSTHMRSEGQGIFEAIREAVSIGEQAQVPVDIIHLKIADKRLWGRMPEVIKVIEEAQAKGLRVTANQYPYVAGQNNLDALIPPWAMEGGREQMLGRLNDAALRTRMEKDIFSGVPGWFDHYLAMKGWESCVVASVKSEKNKVHEGRSIEQISKSLNKKPTDVVFDLLKEEGGSVPAVYFLMSEDDVRTALQTPWVSIGSDGTAVRPDGILGKGKPHPRWYGTFPRVLGKYVREEKVLALEEAIKKMTSLNAAKLGIEDRGLLKAGKKADITIFSADRVIDKATFENPHQYPEGIEYVVVNGTLVIEKGQHLGSKPGRVLYGKGKK